MARVAGLACIAAMTLGCAQAAQAADLVLNGGFESPISAFTDWVVAPDGIFDDTVQPNSGAHDAQFSSVDGDPQVGVLSQDIATTAGQAYVLNFWVLDQNAYFGDTFTVGFGGFNTTISGLEAAPFVTGSYYGLRTYLIDGANITGNTTTLSFQGLGGPAGGAWNLDDVSLTAAAVPEPASWLLMIAGFGMLGTMLRLRGRLQAFL